MWTNSSLGVALGGARTLGCALASQTGLNGAPDVRAPYGLTLSLPPCASGCSTPRVGQQQQQKPSTSSKDIIIFQAEFGDWRKMVIGGSYLGTVAAGINIHCVRVEGE